MSEHVLQGDPPIRVTLRRSKLARRYSLRVSRLDGRVTLTLPTHASVRRGLAFVEEKADWVRGRLTERAPSVQVNLGATIPVRGVPFVVTDASATRLVPELGEIGVSRRVKAQGRAVEKLLKQEARSDLTDAADRFCAVLGRRYSRLDLRDTRSRWGSCSADGRLMFSWRMIMAPPEILEYLVAHEVAHLVHMNHSTAFWSTVERLWPDYRAHRTWLRQNGETLYRYRFDD